MSRCFACARPILQEKNDKFECGKCLSPYHTGCLRMRKGDLEKFLVSSPGQKKAWKCPPCSKASSVIVSEKGETAGSPATNPVGSDFAGLMKYLEARFDKLDKLIADTIPSMKEDIENLKKDNADIKRSIRVIENHVGDLDRGDLNAIEIHGLPRINIRNRFAVTEDILKTCLDIPIVQQDLDDCTFVSLKVGANQSGSTSATMGESSAHHLLIVRFTTRRLREMVMDRWRQIMRKGERTFDLLGQTGLHVRINERLSRSKRDLFFKARQMGKEKSWKYIWMRRGVIYARKGDKEKVISIDSISDLIKLN